MDVFNLFLSSTPALQWWFEGPEQWGKLRSLFNHALDGNRAAWGLIYWASASRVRVQHHIITFLHLTLICLARQQCGPGGIRHFCAVNFVNYKYINIGGSWNWQDCGKITNCVPILEKLTEDIVLKNLWVYFCWYNWVNVINWHWNAGLVLPTLPSPFRSHAHHWADTHTHTVHSQVQEMFMATSISEIRLGWNWNEPRLAEKYKSTPGGPHQLVYHNSTMCRKINPCRRWTIWSRLGAATPVMQQLWS